MQQEINLYLNSSSMKISIIKQLFAMQGLTALFVFLLSISSSILLGQTANERLESRIASEVEMLEAEVKGDMEVLRLTEEQKEEISAIYRKMYKSLEHLDPYTDGKRVVSQAYIEGLDNAKEDALKVLTTEQRFGYLRNQKKLGRD